MHARPRDGRHEWGVEARRHTVQSDSPRTPTEGARRGGGEVPVADRCMFGIVASNRRRRCVIWLEDKMASRRAPRLAVDLGNGVELVRHVRRRICRVRARAGQGWRRQENRLGENVVVRPAQAAPLSTLREMKLASARGRRGGVVNESGVEGSALPKVGPGCGGLGRLGLCGRWGPRTRSARA